MALPVPQMQSGAKRTSLAGRVATAWGVITGADQAWFGPGEPLTPVAPPETAGRVFDYDFAFNNNTRKRAGTAITFEQLRSLADGYDLLRVVLETRKDQLAKCDWQILPKDDKTPSGPMAQKATEFWRSPDKRNGWDEWLRMLLEEMYVIDSVAILPQHTLGGEVHAFELIDGSTINRLIDANGRTPMEGPAYQQILKGVVAGDFTVDELLYRCRNPRVSRLYGYSVVEQIIITVNIALRRQANQLSYYTEGSLPSMVFGVPDTWSPDQIKQMQGWWDDLTIKGRDYQARFIPGGVKPFDLKEQALKDEFDEWLARLVCFAFSIEPTPFVKMTNRATAETARQQSLEEGVAPVQRWVKARIDECLAIQGWSDHHFIWAEEESIDPLVQAQIAQIYVNSKIITADEARDSLGMEPLSDEQKTELAPEAFSPGAAVDGANGGNAAPVPDEQPAAKLEAITLKKKDLSAPEGKLAKILTSFLKARGKEIAASIVASLGLKKSMDPMDDGSRIDGAFHEVDWDWTSLRAKVEPVLVGVATGAGEDALQELGLFSPEVLAQMRRNAKEFAVERAAEMVGMERRGELLLPNPNPEWTISDATRDMIRSTVENALADGWSAQETARAIRESEGFSAARANTIARTEIAIADVKGQLEGWKASGLVAGKQWLTGPNSCDECVGLDGEIVGMEEEFPDGDPPLHPNCVCSLLPILTDELPEHGAEEE